ncbi:peptidase M23 [Planotetraspora thailandica]|uniref:Peptidase M23 n=1 Tax=Planotetraspora thailandica TaxID=487172 RepID=A0A8J3V453_9ACTN|nr:peptidase M23 [Planotetraspora thailandica]
MKVQTLVSLTVVAALGAGCALTGRDARISYTIAHARDGGDPSVDPSPADDEAGWEGVARALGRPGKLSSDKRVYRVSLPRSDLKVTSYGVHIKPGLALGGYAAFTRYPDGNVLMMGDLVVTEPELQKVTDVLQRHGIEQTAVHKHLLSHQPEVWWTHIHAMGRDDTAIAQSVRAALDATATPTAPPAPSSPAPALDIDTAAIDRAMGTKGTNDGGIYKFTFKRTGPVTEHGRLVPPGMGVTTALNFQPTGGGKAAINGDFVMTADEIQRIIKALRGGGIDIVEIHNHTLREQPRLFYMHFWANEDAVKLAGTLHKAVAEQAATPAA